MSDFIGNLVRGLKCPQCGGKNVSVNGEITVDCKENVFGVVASCSAKELNFKAQCNKCHEEGNLLNFQPESCHTCDRRTVGETPTSCMFEKKPKVIENPRGTRCKFYKRIKL